MTPNRMCLFYSWYCTEIIGIRSVWRRLLWFNGGLQRISSCKFGVTTPRHSKVFINLRCRGELNEDHNLVFIVKGVGVAGIGCIVLRAKELLGSMELEHGNNVQTPSQSQFPSDELYIRDKNRPRIPNRRKVSPTATNFHGRCV